MYASLKRLTIIKFFFLNLGPHFSAATHTGKEPCWIFFQETNITGNDFSVWHAITLTDCKSDCAYRDWCLAFSFFSFSSQCRLHNNLETVSDAQSEYYVKKCSATSGKKCNSLCTRVFLLFRVRIFKLLSIIKKIRIWKFTTGDQSIEYIFLTFTR